jgi:hypothetical protein
MLLGVRCVRRIFSVGPPDSRLSLDIQQPNQVRVPSIGSALLISEGNSQPRYGERHPTQDSAEMPSSGEAVELRQQSSDTNDPMT